MWLKAPGPISQVLLGLDWNFCWFLRCNYFLYFRPYVNPYPSVCLSSVFPSFVGHFVHNSILLSDLTSCFVPFDKRRLVVLFYSIGARYPYLSSGDNASIVLKDGKVKGGSKSLLCIISCHVLVWLLTKSCEWGIRSLKPIFHCDAKPFALGTGVGLDPECHT